MKTCTKCKTPKRLEDFCKHKNRKDGLNGWCRSCSSASVRSYAASNPSAGLIKALKRDYGITLEFRDSMFESQGRKCAMCFSSIPRGGKWVVDHCHTTKKVCGIVCRKCNLGIGHYDDSPERAFESYVYLLKTRR